VGRWEECPKGLVVLKYRKRRLGGHIPPGRTEADKRSCARLDGLFNIDDSFLGIDRRCLLKNALRRDVTAPTNSSMNSGRRASIRQ